jgi:predicted glycosyltransferase
MKRSTKVEKIVEMARKLLEDDHQREEIKTDDLFQIILDNIYEASKN